MSEILTALRMTAATLVLLGVAYPLVLTALSQVLFPRRANGSLVTDAAGQVVGSELIAQAFTNPAYFQPRPSAAGAGYDAAASSGSNLGPTSRKLRERIAADVARLQSENPQAGKPIPSELVTASGSGLDPHLSPEAALWQLPRVSAARGRSRSEVEQALRAHIQPRALGVLGEPVVNVLLLNLDLDRRWGPPAPRAGAH